MNEFNFKFEVGKMYSSIAGEKFVCIERTEDTVTFQNETGAKYTPRIDFSSNGIEDTRIGTVLLSSLFSLV